jgi:hypothetical protein
MQRHQPADDRGRSRAVHPPEECDLGEDNGTGEFPAGSVQCDGCRFHARIAFLSSAAYKGGDLGGVEGADLKCQYLANQAGLDNGKVFDPMATCKTWSSSSPLESSRRGLSGVDEQQTEEWMQWQQDRKWTSFSSLSCDLAYQIYCIEQ